MTDRRTNPERVRRFVGRARNIIVGPGEHVGADLARVRPPEERAAHRILQFALRTGGVMLASGAGTIEVESTISEVAHACGLEHCEVDVTFTSMTASYIRADDVLPVTAVQVVHRRSVDYGRLAGVARLRSDLTEERITPEEAFDRLDALLAQRPRRQRLVLLSWAGMAAAFTVLLGGGVLVAAVAFVSTVSVSLIVGLASRRGIPEFFLAALGSAVATGFAMAIEVLNGSARPSLVVAGGIMVLVPGYALVASVQDALTGFPISGTARGLEVLLTATGIITGVAAILYVSVRSGVDLQLRTVVLTPFVQVPVQVAAAAVAAALYATATSVHRRSIALAGVVGAGGWAALLLLRHGGASLLASTAIAAIGIGAASNVLAGRQRTHPFVFIVPGLMPLVPGLTIYEGMLELFKGNGLGPTTLLRAMAIGLAIAAGVTLGSMIVRPPHRGRPIQERRPLSRPG